MAPLIDDPAFSFRRYGGYQETSPETPTYNCVAWAAGQTDAWWWPDAFGVAYWPADVPREESRHAFIKLFEKLGYSLCDSSEYERGFEKIALFENRSVPTHAARMLIEGPLKGSWTSKLGQGIDMAHKLDAVAGSLYGAVVVLMRRPHP